MVGSLKSAGRVCSRAKGLGALATDAAGQLDVLGHDGHALGVDGSQVGVLEQAHQVGLSSLLQGQDCAALEAQVGLEILRDLTHQALEGQLADEQLRALLVLADLAQGDGSRAVPGSRYSRVLTRMLLATNSFVKLSMNIDCRCTLHVYTKNVIHL